jgi:hypothetical protein
MAHRVIEGGAETAVGLPGSHQHRADTMYAYDMSVSIGGRRCQMSKFKLKLDAVAGVAEASTAVDVDA